MPHLLAWAGERRMPVRARLTTGAPYLGSRRFSSAITRCEPGRYHGAGRCEQNELRARDAETLSRGMTERDTDLTDVPAHAAMDQFTAHLDRGWDLIHRGDLRGAQLSAEKALEIDGQAPEAHNLLGFVKAGQGQAEDALESYRTALALDDTFVEAMLNAAEVLIHPLHDFDGAIGMIEEALDLADNDDETADALLLKYDTYMHQGDREGARRVVHSFPQGPFENARLDFLVGRAHFETGGHAQAKALLAHAIAAEPTFGDAHHTLALVHESLGENAAMVRSFLRAREADLTLSAAPWAATSSTAFEELVRAAIKKLTPPLQAALENAELYVSDLPGAEVVVDGIDPRISALLDAGERRGANVDLDMANVDGARIQVANADMANVEAAASETELEGSPQVRRIFFYQRNVERAVDDAADLPEEIALVLEEELTATFPALAPYATLLREDEESGSDH
jgi:Tfp pilus assembly protein PilF